MNSTEYIKKAVRTESPAITAFQNINIKELRLLHAAIGLTGEAGEFNDALKKSIFYGQDLDEVNLKEELGDLLWYIALSCDVLETNFEELMETNIKKLQVRFPDKFNKEKSINRNLVKEREILE